MADHNAMIAPAHRPAWRPWTAAGGLLTIVLIVGVQLACLVHVLVIDAPRGDIGTTLSAQVRAQHAAEQWSGAPCTCDAGQPAVPTHAEPLLVTSALGTAAIVIAATWRQLGLLLAEVPRLDGRALRPATPPPQA